MALSFNQIFNKLKGFFEFKKRNPIDFGNDTPIESDLKPFSIGDKKSIVELSESELNVRGLISADDIKFTGSSGSVARTVNQVIFTNPNSKFDSNDNLRFDSIGSTVHITNDQALNEQLVCWNGGNGFFSINAIPGGNTTLRTSPGDLTIHALGNCIQFGDNTNIFGEINLATATTMKLIGTADYHVFLESQGTGDVTIASGDDITIDATDTLAIDTDGTFAMKQDGTEFSVANSAWAGMILGYRMIGEDAGRVTYTLTTSFVVPDDDMYVRFIAPPSGAVEIMIQIKVDAQANNDTYVGLSSANATSGYLTLGATYEQTIGVDDETDNGTVQHYWAVTGLTAGDTYNYWVGFKKRSAGIGNGYLNWGGDSTGEHCDFIMKATALPIAVSHFAEYD